MKHIFVKLLVRKVHYDLGYFGWCYVLTKIQERFWILHGQSSVHSYLKNCIFCQFHNAKSSLQFMAALPRERLISDERAFFITRCGLFGPIFVTEIRKKLIDGGVFLYALLRELFI